MIFIAFVGLTCAALLGESQGWASAIFSFALASAGVAVLGQIYGRSRDKPAWTGYLVFGTGYLALCVGPWSETRIMPDLATTPFIDDHYATIEYAPRRTGERVWISEGRGFVGGHVFGDVGPNDVRFDIEHDRGTTAPYPATRLRPLSPDDYRRLCHSVISLWTGLAGALLGWSCFGRGRGTTDGAVDQG